MAPCIKLKTSYCLDLGHSDQILVFQHKFTVCKIWLIGKASPDGTKLRTSHAVQSIYMCIDLLALLSAAVITNHTRVLACYGLLYGFSMNKIEKDLNVQLSPLS